MLVRQLIALLQEHNPEHEVHIDVSVADDAEWEGDRVVRHVAGVRVQSGFNAVAIDAASWEQTEAAGFMEA